MTALGDMLGNSIFRAALIVVATFLLQLILRQFLRRILHQAMSHSKKVLDEAREQLGVEEDTQDQRREETLIHVIQAILGVVLWFVALIAILAVFHVDLMALLTGAGAAGLVLGLVGQSAIKDFIAGFFMILENQCRLGDVVVMTTTGGTFSGVVEDLSIRTTRLRDLDGGLHVLTNGSVISLTNHTYEFGKVLVDVIVSYDSDLDKVEKLINKVGASMALDEKWVNNTIDPIQFYRVDALNESSVVVKALGKMDSAGMQWSAAGEFRKQLRKEFAKHNLPLPHQNIVVHKNGGKEAANTHNKKK